MDTEKLDESYVTIHFDSGDNVKLKKSFLTNQSLYFEAMFCGNFIESLSGDKIQLKVLLDSQFCLFIMNCDTFFLFSNCRMQTMHIL